MNPLTRLRLVVRDLLFLGLVLFAMAFFGAGLIGIPYLIVDYVDYDWPHTVEEWLAVGGAIVLWLAFAGPVLIAASQWREGLEGLKRWWQA